MPKMCAECDSRPVSGKYANYCQECADAIKSTKVKAKMEKYWKDRKEERER